MHLQFTTSLERTVRPLISQSATHLPQSKPNDQLVLQRCGQVPGERLGTMGPVHERKRQNPSVCKRKPEGSPTALALGHICRGQ